MITSKVYQLQGIKGLISKWRFSFKFLDADDCHSSQKFSTQIRVYKTQSSQAISLWIKQIFSLTSAPEKVFSFSVHGGIPY